MDDNQLDDPEQASTAHAKITPAKIEAAVVNVLCRNFHGRDGEPHVDESEAAELARQILRAI